MSVLIAVPTFENIMPETFKSIYGLRSSRFNPFFDFVKGYDCATARNNIAQQAIDEGFDYVLMVDSDMIIPNNALEAMFDPPADIVLGLCPRRNTNIKRCEVYKTGTFSYTDYYTYDTLPSEDRFEIKGGGLACGLVSVDVFKALPKPWFKWITYDDGSQLSEDLYFCSLAADHGFKIYADQRVRCGHCARYFQYE
jgi:glycosyltransferase involved in cell wall biosynthesis